jgi:hypothetical protein
MGYIPADVQIADIETLKDQLTIYKENSFIRNLISGYAARFPGKVVLFDQTIESSQHQFFHSREP